MRILLIALISTVLFAADKPADKPVDKPTDKPTPKIFTPSDVESLTNENLKLEYENFQLKVQLNKLMLDSKRQAYIDSTLKAHGYPKDVVYDNDLFIWRMVSTEPAKEPTKEPAKDTKTK